MKSSFNLLISARDPSSSKSLIVVTKKLLLNKLFKVTLLLQNPAHKIFKNNLNKNSSLNIYLISKTKQIQKECYFILKNTKPDILLTGISGPDDGIDEILLKLSNEMRIRTYSLQSFWGHLNKNLGYTARSIFVVDEYSKTII